MTDDECHPLLRELKLNKGSNDGNGGPSPLQVLDHLLKSNALSEEAIRKSIESLVNNNNNNSSNNEAPTKKSTDTKKELALRTRHIALRFFYDGAEFGGLAQNMGQESDNSIEKALFQALLKARLVESRESCKYSRCGRTDRGVSAAGQVVAMYLKSAIPPDASLDEDGKELISNDDLPKNEFEKLKAFSFPRKKTTADRVEKELSEYPYAKILNNLLPPSIRIMGWAPVSPDFSARFSATTRLYRYFFVKRQGMNAEKMQQALNLLTGKHDFRNFCKMDVEKVYNFERVIHSAQVVELSDPIFYLQIKGQAFLWHQIRCIAAVVFMVGNGLEPPDVVTEMLNVTKYPGKPNYALASELPLVLHGCGYANLQVGYSVQNLWTVCCQLERQWENLVLAAARIRNGIDSLKERSVLKTDLTDFATSKITERIKKLRRTRQEVDEEESKPQDSDFGGGAESATVQWSDALVWLQKYGLIPDADGSTTSVHMPLMLRSKGTTYEEKVESVKKSDKRRQKFEDNVIKKRKTAEEDAAFYKHMAEQGGTGM
jgi:tRNA pseudouridine38/39 synthase